MTLRGQTMNEAVPDVLTAEMKRSVRQKQKLPTSCRRDHHNHRCCYFAAEPKNYVYNDQKSKIIRFSLKIQYLQHKQINYKEEEFGSIGGVASRGRKLVPSVIDYGAHSAVTI